MRMCACVKVCCVRVCEGMREGETEGDRLVYGDGGEGDPGKGDPDEEVLGIPIVLIGVHKN